MILLLMHYPNVLRKEKTKEMVFLIGWRKGHIQYRIYMRIIRQRIRKDKQILKLIALIMYFATNFRQNVNELICPEWIPSTTIWSNTKDSTLETYKFPICLKHYIFWMTGSNKREITKLLPKIQLQSKDKFLFSQKS